MKETGLNVKGFKRIVEANDIRHVKNAHPDDLYLLDNLSDMLENFVIQENLSLEIK